MRKFVFSSVAAGLIGGAMLLSGTAPVSALTFPGAAVAAPGETAVVEKVHSRRGDGAYRYDRRRHGERYRHRRSGYRYNYGGYYYSSPWWIGPSISLGLTVPGYGTPSYGGGHVEWCYNRFRSYDAASDTYLGYDGYRHRCNSPYR